MCHNLRKQVGHFWAALGRWWRRRCSLLEWLAECLCWPSWGTGPAEFELFNPNVNLLGLGGFLDLPEFWGFCNIYLTIIKHSCLYSHPSDFNKMIFLLAQLFLFFCPFTYSSSLWSTWMRLTFHLWIMCLIHKIICRRVCHWLHPLYTGQPQHLAQLWVCLC